MGRQRTKVACIECNKAAAKYPESFPIVCNLYCMTAHIEKIYKENTHKYKICKLHFLFIAEGEKKCLQCEYEETDGGRAEPTGEVKIIENTQELQDKKDKKKQIVEKWKDTSPGVITDIKPVIDPEKVEYSETMTRDEYAAWFNKDAQ